MQKSGAQDVILLLGDWLVDEYWVFGVHRSSTASRTGLDHLRALHPPEGAVQTFCGAGRSAYFLHQLYRRENNQAPATSIVGLGFWHRSDTGSLCSLFDPSSAPNNHFRMVTRSSSATPTGVDLINMNEAWNAGKSDKYRDRHEYTTRIIRVYRTEPDRGQLQYERLDWEPPLREVTWKEDALARLTDELTNALRGRAVRAIVVKDMRKGSVTPDIVRWLVGITPQETRWYLSSKEWQPKWLDDVKGVQLKLLMIPQVAAREAVRQQKLSRWVAHSGKPSKDAIDLINTLKIDTKAETIFVLPDEISALGYSARSGEPQCVVQSSARRDPLAVDMGGASIVFPAIVAYMEHDAQASLAKITNVALKTTSEWVEFEAQRILKPLTWKPDHTHSALFEAVRSAVHTGSDIPVEKFGELRELPWSPLMDEWNQALGGLGIVHVNETREFQLWRAMLEVDGYVCCDDNKRKQLREMLQGIRAFARHGRHHASCVLVAGPGTGKSFLAEKLAHAAGLDFIAFNITQMRTRGDIIECFDIIGEKVRHSGHLLVFMDEINADLDRDAVYSTFLTPLEDGTYVHNGRTTRIPPCVWVFAGTEDPDMKPPAEKTKKLSDFVSRLTLGVFNLGRPSQSDIAALERIYVGIALLKREFSEIERTSEAVLQAFRALPESVKGRDIKNFVRRFGDIQYSQVTARSVPDSNWPPDEKGAAALKHWQDHKGQYPDKPDVQIISGT